MIGLCGYGRYDDDPEHVGCPRAQSDMTPCIARDGHTAMADDLKCVGCYRRPAALLEELRTAGAAVPPTVSTLRPSAATQCDTLRDVVRAVTGD